MAEGEAVMQSMKRKILAGMVVLIFVMTAVVPMMGVQAYTPKAEDKLQTIECWASLIYNLIHSRNLIKTNQMDVKFYDELNGKWKLKTVSKADYKTLRMLGEGNIKYYEEQVRRRDELYEKDPGQKKRDEWIQNTNVDFEGNAYKRLHADEFLRDEKIWTEKYGSPPEEYTKNAKLTGGIDFTSIHLNYISTSSNPLTETSAFSYVLNGTKARWNDKKVDFNDAVDLSLNSFFVGLAVPEYDFWVNLKPDEPDRIVEEELGKTDVGRILLEADFQLKKDAARFTNPKTSEVGEEYWDSLYEKAEAVTPIGIGIRIPVKTRLWIVPDKVLVHEDENGIYLDDCTLKVCLESEYLHKSGSLSTTWVAPWVRDVNKYSEELEKELILPKLNHEVNYGDEYADLRAVYHSLILAQWYKDKYGYYNSIFYNLIDTSNVTGLESKQDWNATALWEEYVHSVEEGEYNFWETTTEGMWEVKRYYFSGGVDFTDITVNITNLGEPSQKIRKLTAEAIYSPFVRDRNNYYFGDELYVTDITALKDRWFNEASDFLESGKYEDALESFDNVLAINESFEEAWEGKAEALMQLERYEDAIDAYDNAIKINLNNTDTWCKKGLCLHFLDRYDEAIKAFNKSLEIDSKNDDAWFFKGVSLFESGRNDEALKCLEEYIRIKPNSKEAWCYKGIILKKLKRYEEAMECQNRALKVDPFYESAKEEKGIIEGILKQQKLTPTPTLTPKASPKVTPSTPAFEEIFAIAGLLAVAYFLRREK